MITIDLQNVAVAKIWGTNTVPALYELAKRAPGATAALKLRGDNILIVQDAAAIKHLLRDNPENYDKLFGSFVGFFGDSRLTSDGERWQMLQKLSQPYLTSTKPAGVVTTSTEAFGTAADGMLGATAASDGVAVDPYLDRAAATVVTRVALGFKTLAIDDSLIQDFRAMLGYGSMRLWVEAEGPRAEDPEGRQLYLTARQRVETRIAEAVARSTDEGLLTALVQGQERGVDLISETCTLMFAGIDTTSATVGWGLFLLAAMPDLQAMLRAKVRAACGDEPPTLAQLNTIPELLAFQNEVLRIFPPVPVLGRIARGSDRIGDIDVHENQRIIISIIGLHHDRNHFPSPASLRLGRYPGGETTREQMGHLLPFGAGRRVCGGTRIANVELTTAFAVLLQKLQVSLPDQRELRFEWNASLRRQGGHHFLVQPAPAA